MSASNPHRCSGIQWKAPPVLSGVLDHAGSGADEVLAIPERSSDMESWTGGGLTLWAQDPIGNGLVRKTWQMPSVCFSG
jgi:hypothetical protein